MKVARCPVYIAVTMTQRDTQQLTVLAMPYIIILQKNAYRYDTMDLRYVHYDKQSLLTSHLRWVLLELSILTPTIRPKNMDRART